MSAFNSLNITIIINNYSTESGLKWNLDRLCKRLIEDGHSVEILSFDGEFEQEYFKEQVKVVRHTSPIGFPPAASHLNLKVLDAMNEREDTTDLFHVFNTNCSAGAGLYKLLGGETPVVTTLNNWGLVCPSYKLEEGDPLEKHTAVERLMCSLEAARNPIETILSVPYSQYFWFEKNWLGRHLDAYGAISEYVKNVYSVNGYPDTIRVVSNHLDQTFLDSVAEHNGSGQTPIDTFKILYVGRLVENKGLTLLLEAFDKLDSEAIELHFAGTGPLEDTVKNKDGAVYHGFVDRTQLPQLYFDSDLFVHPATRPEPFGKTILEALHCNLPVVCSNIGAPPEIASNACETFRSGSAESLAATIQELVNNPGKRQSLEQACETEAEHYSFEQVYEKTTEMYRDVLQTT